MEKQGESTGHHIFDAEIDLDSLSDEFDAEGLTPPLDDTDLDAVGNVDNLSGEGKAEEGNKPAKNTQDAAASTQDDGFLDRVVELFNQRFDGKASLSKEGLTTENLLDELSKFLSPPIRPEAYEVHQALEQGETIESFLERINAPDRLISLDDRELMTQVYKDRYGKTERKPDGWDDERIKQAVDARERSGLLMTDAEDAREGLRKIKAERLERLGQHEASTRADYSSPEFQKMLDRHIGAAVEDTLKEDGNKLFGLDLGAEGQKDEIAAIAKKWLQPDPVTRTNKLLAYVDKNNNAIRLSYLLEQIESGRLSSIVVRAKEAGKKSVLDKIRQTPPGTGGGASVLNAEDVDMDSLTARPRFGPAKG